MVRNRGDLGDPSPSVPRLDASEELTNVLRAVHSAQNIRSFSVFSLFTISNIEVVGITVGGHGRVLSTSVITFPTVLCQVKVKSAILMGEVEQRLSVRGRQAAGARRRLVSSITAADGRHQPATSCCCCCCQLCVLFAQAELARPSLYISCCSFAILKP